MREALARFDAYEMQPVQAIDSNGEVVSPANYAQGIDCLTVCEDNDPDIYCWSVYGHLPELRNDRNEIIQCGVECIADCPSREIALAILSVLEDTLK